MTTPDRNIDKKNDPMKYSEFEMLDATENNTIEEIEDIEAMDHRLPSRD